MVLAVLAVFVFLREASLMLLFLVNDSLFSLDIFVHVLSLSQTDVVRKHLEEGSVELN